MVKIYAEVLEETALEQFNLAMEQPFVLNGALMPDAHTGYSLPIGAVIATDNMILPSWVGYDIGCGMCALKLEGIDINGINVHLKEIFDEIYRRIPVGFNVNETETEYSSAGLTNAGMVIAQRKKYKQALGSLGGGNHFIEIGYDENDEIWVVIHSGSRGVGHGIATHYMTVASSDPITLEEEFDATHKDLLKHNPGQYESHKARYVERKMGKLRPKEGHYGFKADSQEGRDYIQDLNWALDYALMNRRTMMERVIDSITCCLNLSCYELDFTVLINRNHNHAVYDTMKDWWVHRKGATHAELGMMGVIPGNMRDGSFIVRGKGNPESLNSSSHGAGRVLGRKEAKRVLKFEDFQDVMGGVTALVTEKTLDESPMAYKDIFEVMRLQEDLVETIHHIRPIINIKG